MLTPEQNIRKVTHLPTLFEYAGFVHLSTGCLIGPYLEFTDYKNWIEFTGPYADMPRGDFSTLLPALTRLIQGFVCMAIYLTVLLVLNIDIYWAGHEDFITYKTFFHRVGYFWLAMTG